ncbi:hypothetical protein Godav_029672 [Gossypium davidsonii]|uniref:Uncharacterized protein n=1 Tax=Gossypium davidsonii TaxID=34287 RepID=A0A7J8T7A5_GOSDV|nr:hypothetical protein [Gossypium davidsonii]
MTVAATWAVVRSCAETVVAAPRLGRKLLLQH